MRGRLPFPRGQTASQGIEIAGGPNGLASTLPTSNGLVGESNAYRPDLAGFIPETTDTVLISGQPMKLRLVQAAADITVARKYVTFSQTAELFGSVSTDPGIPSSGTAGLVSKPIDPAYTVGKVISKYDWFYVVEEGPAKLLAGTTTTAQGTVMSDGNGAAAPCTAGEIPNGIADSAVTADGSATVLVHVTDGLGGIDAAGS